MDGLHSSPHRRGKGTRHLPCGAGSRTMKGKSACAYKAVSRRSGHTSQPRHRDRSTRRQAWRAARGHRWWGDETAALKGDCLDGTPSAVEADVRATVAYMTTSLPCESEELSGPRPTPGPDDLVERLLLLRYDRFFSLFKLQDAAPLLRSWAFCERATTGSWMPAAVKEFAFRSAARAGELTPALVRAAVAAGVDASGWDSASDNLRALSPRACACDGCATVARILPSPHREHDHSTPLKDAILAGQLLPDGAVDLGSLQLATVRALLDAGANPSGHPDSVSSLTPLVCAALLPGPVSTAMLRLLRQRGANVNARDRFMQGCYRVGGMFGELEPWHVPSVLAVALQSNDAAAVDRCTEVLSWPELELPFTGPQGWFNPALLGCVRAEVLWGRVGHVRANWLFAVAAFARRH